MEENNTKRKTKRVLKDISFENDTAHLALVHRDQGGPASGADYKLVVKSMEKYSDEFLEKMSKVRVEMDIVEYLTRFYGLMQTDAEILARSLGYTTPGMEKAILEAKEEMLEDQEPPEYPSWEDEPGDKKYERYVESKVASIEVMKQLYEAENITDVLSNLSEDKYLQLLIDQQAIEKAFKKIDAEKNKPVAKSKVKTRTTIKESTEVAKATSEGDSTNVDVEKAANEGESSPVVKQSNKENKSMTKETVHVTEKEVELVEKSQFDEIQKALASQTEELKKALELVEVFKAEKAQAIAKARKEQIVKSCGKHAEVIFKAVGECEEETFVEVVKALAEMQELVEKSAMFQEQGASVSDAEPSDESPIAKALQARLAKQQKQ